jgi:regulatory protein
MSDEFNSRKKGVYWSVQEANLLIRKYCAFQERSHQEVRFKLLEHGIYGDMLEEIISNLITENFLDEERYACTFASGKFNIKHWGRLKIKQELTMKGVSSYSIRVALEKIADEEYRDVLTSVLLKKAATLRSDSPFERKHKLFTYVQSKGYEPDIIQDVLSDLKEKGLL